MKYPVMSLALLGAVLAGPAVAQVAAEPLPLTIRLQINGASAPVPALKYRLLPEIRDMKPGNAALQYQRAHSPEFFSILQQHPDYDKYHAWTEMPLETFPADKARSLLPKAMLAEVDEGARRSICDWELAERIRRDGLGVLLPDIQVCRTYASLLALRTRLQIYEKNHAGAVYTLQTGYALGRHVAQGPTLINGLVGLAITAMMNKQLEALLQQPDAPNLYWSLTVLPAPFIDVQTGLEGERLFGDALFPGIRANLAGSEKQPLSPADLDKVLSSLALAIGGAEQIRPFAALYAAKIYPEAKAYFLQNGFTEEQLRRFPVTQIALMYAVADYDRNMDEMIKLVRLPYFQAARRFRDVEDKLRAAKRGDILSPGWLAQLMLPAVQKATFAYARVDRQIAALRCVEAIRLYTSANGKLPAALDDIDVPIPNDPVTGRPFDYKLQDGTVHLRAAPPAGETAHTGNALQYAITLRTVQK